MPERAAAQPTAAPIAPPSDGCTLGVLAFGDSITNGGGELQWGVALQSWAHWLARGLGLPYSGFAVDGALARDVVKEQIPRWQRTTLHPQRRYEVGCLYTGVNDVRRSDWDGARFAAEFAGAAGFLGERCERVLALTAPLDLGRPRAGAKVLELNATVESSAARAGALVVDLSDLRARNHVMADHVHPTAFGQIAIAEQALRVLEADGMTVQVWPSQLISYSIGRRRRLQSDWTYVYRHAKVTARSAWVQARARM